MSLARDPAASRCSFCHGGHLSPVSSSAIPQAQTAARCSSTSPESLHKVTAHAPGQLWPCHRPSCLTPKSQPSPRVPVLRPGLLPHPWCLRFCAGNLMLPFCLFIYVFIYIFFIIVKHNTKFTILTIFCIVHSHGKFIHCCTVVPASHLQNFFIIPNWTRYP